MGRRRDLFIHAELGLGWVVFWLGPAVALAIETSPVENVSDTASVSVMNEVSPQGLVVDGERRVIVVWSELVDAEAPPELWMKVRQPNSGWGAAVLLTPADGIYSGDAAMAVDSKGRVHLAWVDNRSGTLEVWIARLDVERGNLLDPVSITSGSGAQLVLDPAIASGPADELAVGWTAMESLHYEVTLRRRSPQGKWGRGEAVTQPDHRASEQVAIAYSPDGVLHLAWSDNAKKMRRILSATVGASGLTAAVEVSPVENGKQVRPTLAVGPTGETALAWQDLREGTEAVYLAVASGTGGFGAPRRVTLGPLPARAPCIVAGAEGVFHLTWEEGNVGNPDTDSSVQVHYARLASGTIAEARPITSDHPVSATNPCSVLDTAGNLYWVWRNQAIGEGDILYRQAAPAPEVPAGSATSSGR